jgi:hypothetical protein
MLLTFNEWFILAKQLHNDYGSTTKPTMWRGFMTDELGITRVTYPSRDVTWIQFISEEQEVFFNLKYLNRQYD